MRKLREKSPEEEGLKDLREISRTPECNEMMMDQVAQLMTPPQRAAAAVVAGNLAGMNVREVIIQAAIDDCAIDDCAIDECFCWIDCIVHFWAGVLICFRADSDLFLG